MASQRAADKAAEHRLQRDLYRKAAMAFFMPPVVVKRHREHARASAAHSGDAFPSDLALGKPTLRADPPRHKRKSKRHYIANQANTRPKQWFESGISHDHTALTGARGVPQAFVGKMKTPLMMP